RAAACLNKRRHILDDFSTTGNISVCTDFRKLNGRGHSADYCMIAYFNMTGKLHGIGNNHMVSYNAIVGDMGISHQQTITAYYGSPFIFRSPVDGNTFSDGGIVAYFNHCVFTVKFKVLWNSAHYSSGKDLTSFSYG